jgi:hypothetical protein
MKTTLMISLFLIGLTAPTAQAVAPSTAPVETSQAHGCQLTHERARSRDALWNKLSREYLLATMNADKDPGNLREVRAEIERTLSLMRRSYGPACVLDIL